MAKKLHNIAMFVEGEPQNDIPSNLFITYDVKSGKGKKSNNVFEILDPDSTKSVQKIWDESITEIKTLEGIE